MYVCISDWLRERPCSIPGYVYMYLGLARAGTISVRAQLAAWTRTGAPHERFHLFFFLGGVPPENQNFNKKERNQKTGDGLSACTYVTACTCGVEETFQASTCMTLGSRRLISPVQPPRDRGKHGGCASATHSHSSPPTSTLLSSVSRCSEAYVSFWSAAFEEAVPGF